MALRGVVGALLLATHAATASTNRGDVRGVAALAALATARAATTRVEVGPKTSEFLDLAKKPRVRALLDANDKLRRLQLAGFDFPRIVVIGDQSAGKSSVLEAISGVQLLRGTGVVTRAPIELRLTSSRGPCEASVEAEGVKSWTGACGSIGEALNATMRALPGLKPARSGARRGITEEVVRLKVAAPGAPELTLVDLPGLARVATEGQRPDVPELTRRLSKAYCAPYNTIVLVVCACNADLATAEALRLAAEADPDGLRTIGVLTKPDLMDPGTENSVQDILSGKVVKLERHGYFVVRNRGQLSRHVTPNQALQDEASYFRDHPTFGKLKGRFGAPALAQYLANVLTDAIARDVPEARRLVDTKERDGMAKLQALGEASDLDTPSQKRARLVRVATDFAQAVQEATRGKSDGERGLTADVLALYRNFDEDIRSRAPSRNASAYAAKVRVVVAEKRGREAFYGFPSAQVFAGLVADLVDDVRAPAERVVSDVRARVLVEGRLSAAATARRFPALKKRLEELVAAVAAEKYVAAKGQVSVFLDAQRHPFAQDLLVTEASKTESRPTFRPQSRPTSSDAFEGQVDFVARQIDRYFGIFATRVADVVPMAADYVLVQNLGRDLALTVADAAHGLSDDHVASLLAEDPDVSRQRAELRDELGRLLSARETLDDYAAGGGLASLA